MTRRVSPEVPVSRGRHDVPFVDLLPANATVKDRVQRRIADLVDRGDFIDGAAVAEFEEQFAAFVGRRHAVGVASGLDALRLALLASGLASGDRVVTPASTFAATLEAVIQAGGAPVIVDVRDDTYTLDIDAAARAADDSVTHILPVHLYGQMADMKALVDVAEAQGLKIVEDACQAHGARRDGVQAGGAGLAAAFSFYPSKNLGAFGDAGAIVTDDDELASLTRALRSHGETRKYRHEYEGYTARLDTLQALVLLEKLPLLEQWNAERRAAAAFYDEALAGLDVVRLPTEAASSESVWHLYVVRTPERDELAAFLLQHGIHTGRHYPEPVHLAPAYSSLGYGVGDFPVAEALASEGLSLPLYPGITESQLSWVCEAMHLYARAVE